MTRRRRLLAAGGAMLIGSLAILVVFALVPSLKQVSEKVYHCNALTAIVAAGAIWYQGRWRRGSAVERGAMVGLSSTVAGFVLGSYVAGVVSWVGNMVDPGAALNSFGEAPYDPIRALPVAVALGVVELLTVGMFVAPIAMVVGFVSGPIVARIEGDSKPSNAAADGAASPTARESTRAASDVTDGRG